MKPLHAAMLTVALFGAFPAPASAISINSPQDQSAKTKSNPGAKESTADRIMRFFTGKKKAPEKSDKKSERPFIDGYRHAYALVYEKQDYSAAIGTLRTLGRDEHPDVANLIGFSSRKLGRTEDARVWYEKALAADPNHTRTWQYYGMWHLERGDRAKAEEHLRTIATICGTECEDYTSLKLALAGEGLVY
jgi:tetratricopeptide (TPR) repeat protein